MRICIIGAGVAGLQCAEVLCDEHECHVFEARTRIGGVWHENYSGYGLQVPSQLYEFVGDAAPPEARGTFPPGEEVQAYIEGHVAKQNLQMRCDFHMGERVESVRKRDDGKWTIQTPFCEYACDYCIVCTGMYHTPHWPARAAVAMAAEVPSEEPSSERQPQRVHSSEFHDATVVEGKRVVVVGGGKSAIDCAVAAAKHGALSVTLKTRRLHWPVPRRILDLVPFQWGTYSRLGHFLLMPAHWTASAAERWWHDRLDGVKRAVWALLERVFAWQFAMPTPPSTPLVVDLFNGGQILTYECRDMVRDGRIRLVVGDDAEVVDDDEAEVVVYATGFEKMYTPLLATLLPDLDVQHDGLWLYKNVVPPRVDGLAFVGSEVSTFNNILTQRLQAEWVAHHLAHGEALPSVETMEAYVDEERTWKRSWMPASMSRASLVQLHMTPYHDSLCRDMGRPLVRTRWWEWLIPLTARDYAR